MKLELVLVSHNIHTAIFPRESEQSLSSSKTLVVTFIFVPHGVIPTHVLLVRFRVAEGHQHTASNKCSGVYYRNKIIPHM